MNVEKLFEQAKEEILRDGELGPPALYVEYLEKGEAAAAVYILVLPEGGTMVHQKMVLGLGLDFAREHPQATLTHLCLCGEVWHGPLTQDGLKKMRKGESLEHMPGTKEMILIEELQLQAPQPVHRMHEAEILRAGDQVDLVHHEPGAIHPESSLVTAFHTGVLVIQQPDQMKQLLQEVDRRRGRYN